MSDIPVIDIAPFSQGDEAARRRVARDFSRAFETIGFATIVGHGVDPALIRRTYDIAHDFFRLPLAEKSRSMEPGERKKDGYIPVGSESVAATLGDKRPHDLCEALVFGSIGFEGRPSKSIGEAEFRRPNFWPANPPELRPVFTEYYWALDRLLENLMRISALALDLPETWFLPYYEGRSGTLRAVLYPEPSGAPAPGQLRNGAHRDYGGLTILRQDRAEGGLQVCRSDGTWTDVRTPDDAFIINVGDLIARWTNDRWLSSLHRVVNPPAGSTNSRRLSLVLFTGPRYDAMVECLPGCSDARSPPKYPPVRAVDHTREKVRQHLVGGYAGG